MNLNLSKEDGVRPVAPVGRTYIAFVLDRSGSMQGIKQQTIDGFNKQIETIKKEAVGETFVSLVTFGTDVTPIFFNKPLDRIGYLNHTNYTPNGWTALYDAVGYTINRLANEAQGGHDAAFWVIIVSDGEENHSVDYKLSLPALIRAKQYTGKWTFSYVGSNQDLSAVAVALSIPYGNTLTWVNNAEGTGKMYATSSDTIGVYMTARSQGLTSVNHLYNDQVTVTKTNDAPIVPNLDVTDK